VAQRFHALTVKAKGGLLRVILTDCQACAGFDPHTTPQHQHPPLESFRAIWDTGATSSVITDDVVNRCGLKPTGMVQVQHAQGVSTAETFIVNIMLPQGVGFTNLTVTRGNLSPGVQMLLGMDVITKGDLSITNVGGRTVFSFRVPSVAEVDFVEQSNAQTAHAQRVANRKQRKAKKHRKPWQR